MAGVFVAFEGGEGGGKSTQAQMLADHLSASGHSTVHTRQPGGTDVGGRIRSILLDPSTGDLGPKTEALLHAADKAEHADSVIIPALRAGSIVVCDRYTDSTLAYQGAGRDLERSELESAVRWATRGLRPDVTVLLDIDPMAGLQRVSGIDRIEAEPIEFHRRVRESFLEFARRDPEHYLLLDAVEDPDQIHRHVRMHVEALLEQS